MAGSTFKDPNIGPTGVAVPAEAGQIGGPDAGGLLQAPRVYDTDSGAGTENTLGVVLRSSGGGGSVEAIGQKTMAASIPVVVASDQSAIPVSGTISVTKSTINAQSTVVAAAVDTTLLAANAARLGATVFNDSSAILYLKLGIAASLTSFTAQLAPNSYYEVPFSWAGAINGIWASATGNARITELT